MNIYIGSLSQDTTEQDLTKLFEEFGEVTSTKVISDKSSGESKGFGFVEMKSNEKAQEAIEALNGREVNGRAISVNEARPKR